MIKQAIIGDFKKDEKVLQDFTPTYTGALPSIDLFLLDTTNEPVTLIMCLENPCYDSKSVLSVLNQVLMLLSLLTIMMTKSFFFISRIIQICF
jgi:hypothetical protein